jgi:hypothetical protein
MAILSGGCSRQFDVFARELIQPRAAHQRQHAVDFVAVNPQGTQRPGFARGGNTVQRSRGTSSGAWARAQARSVATLSCTIPT